MAASPILVLLCTFLVLCEGQHAEKVINICESRNGTITRLARVTNPAFPNITTSPSVCKCHLGNSLLSVKSTLILAVGGSQTQPLLITYRVMNMQYTWPSVDTSSDWVMESNGDVTVAENASDVWITMDMNSASYTQTLFRIDVKVMNESSTLSVTCSAEDSADVTTPGTTKDILQFIDDKCSSELIIILGSLCVAFLIIIMVVSILLCCIVPRKRRELLVELRKSQFIVQEIQRSSNGMFLDVPRDSCLYDDAEIGLSQSRTLPNELPNQSQNLYSNATAIQSR